MAASLPAIPDRHTMSHEDYRAARAKYMEYVLCYMHGEEARAATSDLYNAEKPTPAEREAERVEFERMIDSEQAGAARDKIKYAAELETARAEAIDFERRLALRIPGTIRDLTKQLKTATRRVSTLVARIEECDKIISSRSYAGRVINDRRDR